MPGIVYTVWLTKASRKSLIGLGLLASIFLAASIGAGSYSAQAAVKTFKNCTELNKSFKYGVATSSKSVNRGAGPISKPTVSTATFKKNQKLDKDKDGIICEVLKLSTPVSKPGVPLVNPSLPADNSLAKAQSLDTCKLQETRNITGAGAKGFPARQAVPATGTVKVAVIPVDFYNAVETTDPQALFSDDVQKIKEWGSFFSRGKMTYDVELGAKTWIRAPKGGEWYTCMECYKGAKEQKQPQDIGIQELVTAADASYNFAGVKIIYFVLPYEAEQKFGTAVYGQRRLVTDEGPITATVYGEMGGGFFKSDRTSIWEHAIHEFLHFQGFIGHGPENGSSYYISTNQWGEYKAVTAWEAFLNGWFAEDEVLCLDKSLLSGDTIIDMSSIDDFGPKKEAVMVKIDSDQIVVIERRTRGPFQTGCTNCRQKMEPGFTAYRINVNAASYRDDMDPTAETKNFWSYIREQGSPVIKTSVEFQGLKITKLSETVIKLSLNN
jgi:hypothetical protein